jgi:hypothetical protein
MAECWKDDAEDFFGPQTGTWDYEAGTSGVGAVTLTGTGHAIQGVRIRADAAATFNIDGGDTVTLKKNEIFTLNPNGQLSDPTINVLSGTIEWFIEFVS